MLPRLANATVAELSEALSNGKISSAALTATYLARIEEVNDHFHAVIETNPDALFIAKALDEEQQLKGRRGPLHGIPILLKDIFVTLDKMETTCGSLSLVGARPAKEADVVKRLRAAGAVILGKTNISQWSGFRTFSGGSGWSSRGGLCLGAFCDKMKASGSSSGSAVATALGLAAACIGAETEGSIMSPASRNGVVGFKPTVGEVSPQGIIPVALRQDSAGPITRSVEDAACILDVISQRFSSEGEPSYSASLSGTNLSGLRIGIPSSSLPESNDAIMVAFQKAIASLSSAGAKIVHDANYAGLEQFKSMTRQDQYKVMAGQFQQDIKDYFSTLETNPNNLKDLGDVIRLLKEEPREEFPERGTDLLELADNLDTNGLEYQKLLEDQDFFSGEGGIPGTMKALKLDLIIAPAMVGPTVAFAARAGLPAAVVPLGIYPKDTPLKYSKSGPDHLVDVAPNIPFGIVFIGARGSDRTLLRVAHAFELLTMVRNQLMPFNPPVTDLSSDVSSHERVRDAKV